MTRLIKKVAVLGSGVMGSRIACHFANIGLDVLLLDIVPRELLPAEEKTGLTKESKTFRNRIVNEALQFALKSSPSPVYHPSVAGRISVGNFDDDLDQLKDRDWVIEAVVENLAIKQSLYEKVEKVRKPGSLISSNTSGIPIALMAQGRSDDFRKNFCGTHFFNPPRYLKLLEVIPGPETDVSVIDFFMSYGEKFLGKTTVLCKDTPAFIANRIGIFAIMNTLQVTEELGLTVDEIDKLTGPVVGRQKSATFRTMDVVGNDTLIKVSTFLYENAPNDEARDAFKLTPLLQKIEDNKWYGSKSGQGFYKKVTAASGKSEIHALDLKTFEYKHAEKVKFTTLEATKTIDKLSDRFKVLLAGTDKAGEFYRKTFYAIFSYVSNRIPEIAEELYKIDDAIKAGFGWEMGPFETWDALGVAKTTEAVKAAGFKVSPWIDEFVAAGHKSFYKIEDGIKKYYDPASKTFKEIPGLSEFILLDNLRPTNKLLWKNAGASIYDIGDGVLNLEFHSKMNTMGGEVVQGINKAIDMAENDGWNGLVIANEGPNFSAGANLAMVFMYAADQEYDELDMMIRQFQNTMMRVRYSGIPVVVAPHGMALGGGCEITLHADKVQAHAELYTGLVEFGVGLIPAGGGTKELTLRVSDAIQDGDLVLNDYKNAFLNIAMAKVSTSAREAFDLNILRRGDKISINKNRQIQDAKMAVLEMASAGYTKPVQRKDVMVYGKQVLGMFYAGAMSMRSGNFISDHDVKISRKLAYIMAGGDLSSPTNVSEQYLLDLEREAFLSLLGERKTLERIQSILTSGKPLRN